MILDNCEYFQSKSPILILKKKLFLLEARSQDL